MKQQSLTNIGKLLHGGSNIEAVVNTRDFQMHDVKVLALQRQSAH